jgi:hypothetical protein
MDEKLTDVQVAEMAGMSAKAFKKMASPRKPTRQADKTFLRVDVEEWLSKRKGRTAMVVVVKLPNPAPVMAPVIKIQAQNGRIQAQNGRGRLIDGEDEHVLNERLDLRKEEVKLLTKVIQDMTADVVDLENLLAKKKKSLRVYQQTRDAFRQDAALVERDLVDADEQAILDIEDGLRNENVVPRRN